MKLRFNSGESREYSCIKALYLVLVIVKTTRSQQENFGTRISCDADNATAKSRNFAYALYNTASGLIGQRKNILLSPLAVGMALSMVSFGTTGLSRNQIFGALNQTPRSKVPDRDLCLLHAYHANRFNSQFLLKNNALYGTATLRTATRIFGEKNLTFSGDFVRNTGIYGAEIAVVPFKSAPRYAARQINKWVSDQTDGKIKEIIRNRYINKDTMMAITCAMHFKAKWIIPFVNMSTAPFYLQAKRRRMVDFMTSLTPLKHTYSDALQADIAEVSYEVPDGSNIDPSLILILPNESVSVRDVERLLNDDAIFNVLRKNTSDHIRIRIPKFLLSGSQKLKYILKRMGVREIFSKQNARIDATEETGDRHKRLFISATEHKASFEVGQHGTYEQAPQIKPIIKESSFGSTSRIIVYDRVFIFLLYDKFTDTIIHIGRLSDPKRKL